ncbi:exodeoxyribonuclease V subunit gamma [Oryzisolibacter sp. LB2S]|uniref:exodeoxyribonuclease V subunit gamma n=1 Tax=Alicycliphilus soli TaxID=3228789 RepID=UPI003458AD58
MPTACPPGLIALHSNRTDQLLDTVAAWLQQHPLEPLESEVVLVQSNGMAEWVKMQLAGQQGICAAAQVELPARFVWRTCRQVLGRVAVPASSALDKAPLVWRLLRLLPTLVHAPLYAPLSQYLRPGEPERLLQLAQRLADLYDQYQIYRGDWLAEWSAGRAVLTQPGQDNRPLPEGQEWQCALWQALQADLTEQERAGARGAVLARVLAHLQAGQAPAQPVARRVVVFGLSHMPLSLLQLLAALARHSQVLLAVPNPCRFHWADAIDGRELLRQAQRRHPLRGGRDLAAVPLEAMHAHAHPLLAAWGRQSRDTVRQLDAFDTTLQMAAQLDWPRVDLYDDAPAHEGTLLEQVQRSIRDLLPLAEHPRSLRPEERIAASDRSIVFHSAHSLVRELEVLHDQLLDLLAAPPAPGQAPLQPRDIVVMLPDVQTAAPAIRAVFGQYPRHDARHIPFDIADLSARQTSPLVAALQWLLQLPRQRLHLSQLCDLLQVGAVAQRLGLAAEDLPQLITWMQGAGIRWGLHAEHRASLDLAACGEDNSAWFGLRRMLLGYASGAGPAWEGVEPYDEVGGLSAELAGALATVLQVLQDWWQQGRQEATPLQWAAQLRALLQALFAAQTEAERAVLAQLHDALNAWLQDCDQAGFDAPIPLAVAQAAWLTVLDAPTLQQRFRAGGVTFCTLMPMRAIPFEVVCLLGMNEGDYPRRAPRSDFDLMAERGQYRPGDRARRDDDRQLMLDALLSARRQLYLSWTGQNLRDNTMEPPSVLVAQLRDYLAAGWRGEGAGDDALLSERSSHHPLQPFSRAYFEAGSPLHTHAREWRAAHGSEADNSEFDSFSRLLDGRERPVSSQISTSTPSPLTLRQLQGWLRHPARAFFQQRLQVFFDDADEALADEEPFHLDGLDNYQLLAELQQQVCSHWLAQATGNDAPGSITQSLATHVARLQGSGRLPLAGLGQRAADHLQAELLPGLRHWSQLRAQYPHSAPALPLDYRHADTLLQDWLPPLWLRADALSCELPTWIDIDPRHLAVDDAKSGPQPRPDKLLPHYLRSLAAAACGQRVAGVVVGLGHSLAISPMEPDAARSQLDALLALWQQGQAAPLPLPFKTALALLEKDIDAAWTAYEGGFDNKPAPEIDAYWQRLYPDFAALTADGQFEDLAPMALQGLLQWCRECVEARALAADA